MVSIPFLRQALEIISTCAGLTCCPSTAVVSPSTCRRTALNVAKALRAFWPATKRRCQGRPWPPSSGPAWIRMAAPPAWRRPTAPRSRSASGAPCGRRGSRRIRSPVRSCMVPWNKVPEMFDRPKWEKKNSWKNILLCLPFSPKWHSSWGSTAKPKESRKVPFFCRISCRRLTKMILLDFTGVRAHIALTAWCTFSICWLWLNAPRWDRRWKVMSQAKPTGDFSHTSHRKKHIFVASFDIFTGKNQPSEWVNTNCGFQGTGTALGDPIEVGALRGVMQERPTFFLNAKDVNSSQTSWDSSVSSFFCHGPWKDMKIQISTFCKAQNCVWWPENNWGYVRPHPQLLHQSDPLVKNASCDEAGSISNSPKS